MVGAIVQGAAAIGGGVLGAVGEAQQGKADRKSMRRQRRHLRRTRDISLDRFDTQSESFLSQQQQQYGISGVDLEGSPLLVAAESEQNLAQDRSMMEMDFNAQIKDLSKAIKQSRKNQRLGVASSILGGVGGAGGAVAGII